MNNFDYTMANDGNSLLSVFFFILKRDVNRVHARNRNKSSNLSDVANSNSSFAHFRVILATLNDFAIIVTRKSHN